MGDDEDSDGGGGGGGVSAATPSRRKDCATMTNHSISEVSLFSNTLALIAIVNKIRNSSN